MSKVKGIVQVDLNNDLAMRYLEVSLRSFECVSDIFEIEIEQCVTPDTLLDELKDVPLHTYQRRSPMELAAMHTHYRNAKRMSEGQKFWAMEHDAYLRNEEVFRMLMSKWHTFPCAEIGTSNEFYTMWPEVAKIFCAMVKDAPEKGPLSVLRIATDKWCNNVKHDKRTIYWPADRRIDERWCNVTGVDYRALSAARDPNVMIHSPITQLADEKYGGTVNDRKHGQKLKSLHPDFHWVDLDP